MKEVLAVVGALFMITESPLSMILGLLRSLHAGS